MNLWKRFDLQYNFVSAGSREAHWLKICALLQLYLMLQGTYLGKTIYW